MLPSAALSLGRISATLSLLVMLATGTRLGPYELLSPLGAGGMGEVYRARDTRLDRAVAIKVLPQHLSSDPQRRQRFEREARAVSSLSHPNICALYDVGQQGGIDYLVMEYIEGESLADRLTKGPLPIDQALRYATQVADALDKAHRAGIVHRDLKPANIMLTKSGAKLLDFGLAKLLESDSQAVFAGQSNLPTERVSFTGEGTIVGTFQYMAPEQLEAGRVDARTDIFAFGTVLYEMVTGRKAFRGKSQASLIGAILKDDPPSISTIQPMSPPALDHVVKTCLAKEPDERWQTAHDLAQELKWISEGGSQTAIAAPAVPRQKSRERSAWIAAAAFFITAVVFALPYLFYRAAEEPRAVRFFILPPEKSRINESLALSPDGQRLAFTAIDPTGKTLLWVRALDSLSAQPLSGTEGARFPFWSPDGRLIGFFSGGKLKKMELSGGPAQAIADVSDPRGGSWNRDGMIVFSPDATSPSPLYRVSAAGGEATQLTTLDESRQEWSHRWPFFLPDGLHFLYLARSSQRENSAIYVGSVDSKDKKLLVRGESSAAYVQADESSGAGYLLFVRDQSLMAQPFDPGKLEVSGEPNPIAQNVLLYGEYGPTAYRAFSVSSNGVLCYRPAAGLATQLGWYDRSGKRLGLIGEPARYGEPVISPDGKRAAFNYGATPVDQPDVWVADLSRPVMKRFTFSPRDDTTACWSPDGSLIVFCSNREIGKLDIYQKVSSGAGSEELLLHTDNNKFPDDWSPDGRFIIYEEYSPGTKADLWLLPMFGERKPYLYLQTEFQEAHAAFSPDGRWVAYVSDESGRAEAYVQSFPRSGGKWQISTVGGDQPRWRRDGKELYYIGSGKNLMAVPVMGGASFEAGAPAFLFETHIRPTSITDARNNYVPSADGQRFLVSNLIEHETAQPISVVLNWAADLKR